MHLFRNLIAIAVTLAMAPTTSALAWGDEGHRIIALIGQALLKPAVRAEVVAMLGSDQSTLTAHDIASEATWADRIRAVNQHSAREKTSQWHFVNIEIGAPDIDQACFGHPVVPAGVWASRGPARDCLIDKIIQFEAELAQRTTPAPERLVALKFFLHLIGDLHQPLHTSDSEDGVAMISARQRQGLRRGGCTSSGTRHSSADWAPTLRRSPLISSVRFPAISSAPGPKERLPIGPWRHSRSPEMMPMVNSLLRRAAAIIPSTMAT
jgi:hypothetical protein